MNAGWILLVACLSCADPTPFQSGPTFATKEECDAMSKAATTIATQRLRTLLGADVVLASMCVHAPPPEQLQPDEYPQRGA